jgi:hypothetical protein
MISFVCLNAVPTTRETVWAEHASETPLMRAHYLAIIWSLREAGNQLSDEKTRASTKHLSARDTVIRVVLLEEEGHEKRCNTVVAYVSTCVGLISLPASGRDIQISQK